MMQSGDLPSLVPIVVLLVLLTSIRSTAVPFFNPKSELAQLYRDRFKSSISYIHTPIILYFWVVSTTSLALLPHFAPSQYHVVVAASLFVPGVFVSVAALLIGRYVIRGVYYALSRFSNNENISNSTRMIPFHRPFRRLLRTSALLSGTLCMLFALCWTTNNAQPQHPNATCHAVFWPFGALSFSKSSISVETTSISKAILLLWLIAIVVMLIHHAYNEFRGMHILKKKNRKQSFNSTRHTPVNDAFDPADNDAFYDDGDSSEDEYEDNRENDDDRHDFNVPHLDENNKAWTNIWRNHIDKFVDLNEDKERPQDTLPMVPWYSMLLVKSGFDILLQLKVFLGRYDARSMQPALQRTNISINKIVQKLHRVSHPKNELPSRAKDEKEYLFELLKNSNPGCLFDLRRCHNVQKCHHMEVRNRKGSTAGDFWFDFMADCGDGFDSSYQVARLIAQPSLPVIYPNTLSSPSIARYKSKDDTLHLPRGSVLVIGGDLAYPDPTTESYEKRLFRTFEDALPPPPTFRREAISIMKPAVPLMQAKISDRSNKNGSLKQYDGPLAFTIPGNHDWFDGLATYARYILSRDWLGGWMLPQERSYFALALPRGWWLLGMDLALGGDIDIEQFKFFAEIGHLLGPDDAIIVVTHEPSWVIDADARKSPSEMGERNLRELLSTHFPAKLRLRLAGDIHNYTRHSPVPKKEKNKLSQHRSQSLRRSVSLPNERNSDVGGSTKCVHDEDNLPELIVSGGGGAFLHPTHTFSNMICVGEEEDKYVRVTSYPSENVSYNLSWINLWQFRWRNWRLDAVWVCLYFGIVSSLFPLCGIYEDYLEADVSHNPSKFITWVISRLLLLFQKIFSSGKISALFVIFLFIALFLFTDDTISPGARLVWSCCHSFTHVMAALLCLLCVECIVEWGIHEHIGYVTASTSSDVRPNVVDTSPLHQAYETYFLPLFEEGAFSEPFNFSLTQDSSTYSNLDLKQLYVLAIHYIAMSVQWIFYEAPVIQTTMSLFDLPGLVLHSHNDMCGILCKNGYDCTITGKNEAFHMLDRLSIVKYWFSVSLYFGILAIPIAASVFGGFLALSLNILKIQWNEGFSSLRIQHWKNFVKFRIKSNGELEVYSIGLNRVPKRWVRDPEWSGGNRNKFNQHHSRTSYTDGSTFRRTTIPSWKWRKPSKWIPERASKKYDSRIVDHCVISKTSFSKGEI